MPQMGMKHQTNLIIDMFRSSPTPPTPMPHLMCRVGLWSLPNFPLHQRDFALLTKSNVSYHKDGANGGRYLYRRFACAQNSKAFLQVGKGPGRVSAKARYLIGLGTTFSTRARAPSRRSLLSDATDASQRSCQKGLVDK